MDLVEIRKKAKSQKTRTKKTAEKRSRTAGKKESAEKQPHVEAEKSAQVETADLPDTPAGEVETEIVDKHTQKDSGKSEKTPATVMSLEDVLVSQHEEVKEEEEEQLQLLTFQLADEDYALNIMDIKEIIRPRETTDVPRTPEYILGIFSLRGTIIPVFDVNLRLGLPRGEKGPQNRVIVVKYREHLFGLYVDNVVQVLDIPLSRIEPPPEILGGVEGEFLRGIARLDEQLIILLNLGRILKMDDGDDSGHLELPRG